MTAERPIHGMEMQRRISTLASTLIESERVLRTTFDVNVDLMGRRGQAALTFLDWNIVNQVHVNRLNNTNAMAYEMSRRGLPSEIISPASIIESTEFSDKLYFSASVDHFGAFGNGIPDIQDKVGREKLSKAAVAMFDTVLIRILETAPNEIPLERNEDAIKLLRGSAKDFIKRKAQESERTQEILEFAEEFDASFEEDESLRLVARGAQVELWTKRDNRDLKVVAASTGHQLVLLDYIRYIAEEAFKQQMVRRCGTWFVSQEGTPIQLGVEEQDRKEIGEIINALGLQAQEPGAILEAFLSSKFGLFNASELFGVSPAPAPAPTQDAREESVSDQTVEETKIKREKKDKRKKQTPTPPPQKFGRKPKPAPKPEVAAPIPTVEAPRTPIKYNPPPEYIFETSDVIRRREREEAWAQELALRDAERKAARERVETERKTEEGAFWEALGARIAEQRAARAVAAETAVELPEDTQVSVSRSDAEPVREEHTQLPVQEPIEEVEEVEVVSASEERVEKEEYQYRLEEIMGLANKALRTMNPNVHVFSEENIVWADGEEYQKRYEQMPESDIESFEKFLLGNMGLSESARKKRGVEGAFVDYSWGQPVLILPKDSYSFASDSNLDRRSRAEFKFASDVIATSIASSIAQQGYERSVGTVELMKEGLTQKGELWRATYGGIDPQQLNQGVEMMRDIVEGDQSAEIVAQGMQLIFKMRLNTRDGEKTQLLPVAGENLDRSIVRYITGKVVDQMTLEMMIGYPQNQQIEAERRYRQYLADLEKPRGEFRRVDDFLKNIGVKGNAKVFASYQSGQLPAMFLKARLKKPELAYSL